MTAPATEQTAKKSIWKNKWFWIAIGGLFVLGLILNALGYGKTDDAKPAAAEQSTATETAAVEEIEIPDVAGLPGNEARETLSNLGLMVQYDGGDEAVVAASNWDATGTDPAAGTSVAAGSTVTLQLVRADERLAAEKKDREAETAAREADYAATPLEAVEAQVFCENYSELQFPYGVKLHTVMGKLAEEQTEAGWYMKFEATVTNEFNAERKMNVECHMSGTNGAPAMDDFLAY
ncbi:PASTA domain-containing protein [Leucobacter sp.]